MDVIYQNNKNGSMIPMRIRLKDEDGAIQSNKIKNYEDLFHQGTRTMPDGIYVTDRTFVYECQVQTFGIFRMIRVYYDLSGAVWKKTIWEYRVKNDGSNDIHDDIWRLSALTGS